MLQEPVEAAGEVPLEQAGGSSVGLLIYLGPRRNAAARALRGDVDLERGTIRLHEKGGKVIVKPLPDELVEIIRGADEAKVWSDRATT